AIIDDAQNQFHRVIALSLPNKGWTHTIAKPLLHGLKRIRILLVIAPNVVRLGPEPKVACANVQGMKPSAFAIRTIDRAAGLVGVIIRGLKFFVVPNKRQLRGRKLAQACLLLIREVGEHVMSVCAVLKYRGKPGWAVRRS